MKKNSPDAAIELAGWWVSLSEEENTIICQGLTDAGYEPDPAGLRKFVIDIFMSEDDVETGDPPVSSTDRVIRNLGDYVREHPEIVGNVTKAAAGMFNKFMKSRK